MVNGKPGTDNGFRFHTTCIDAAIVEMLGYAAIQTLVKTPLSRRRCNFGDAWIHCHSETLVKTPLFGGVGCGQYHHQIRRQWFGVLQWVGLRRKSHKGTKRKERDWGPTDRQECNGEDKIARLKSHCTIRCLQYINKTILLCQH